MNMGELHCPLFHSSKPGPTEEGGFPAVSWPISAGPCAGALEPRLTAPAGTAKPLGLAVPEARDVSQHGAPGHTAGGSRELPPRATLPEVRGGGARRR